MPLRGGGGGGIVQLQSGVARACKQRDRGLLPASTEVASRTPTVPIACCKKYPSTMALPQKS